MYTCQEAFVSYLHVPGSFCFLCTRARKLLFLIYTCQETFVSYLHVPGNFCFLFTRARKLLFLIYMLLIIRFSAKEITQHQALVTTVFNFY